MKLKEKPLRPAVTVFFPKNVEVASISTNNGATIMMIYDPVESGSNK